ncbi:cytochrome c peroxidase [Dyadobacter sp. SG02]|uniref:cytochrome-c peroxidase n=1 Tax=Dyadobacter sp. SG02 TaxID=1855291 RepID=UPI0008CE6A4B|nr:cytochrome c peroxidase [Dyadobacter sp. SG02]SEI52239.1 cytochrome c peroxidase [Dyadobacter sp. SG02]
MPLSLRKSWYLLLFLSISAAVLYGWPSDRTHTRKSEPDSLRYRVGEALFFDKRLSITNTKSCASCHNPELAFTDGYRKSPGVFADLHARNTPTLLNISRQNYLNWANPGITSLTDQMNGPLFGNKPIEMGLSQSDTALLAKLSRDPLYARYCASLPDSAGKRLTWDAVKSLLASYLLTLNSFSSPYDRYAAGHKDAISASARRGEQLFFSNSYGCAHCHRPPTFGADSTMPMQEQFANIGLYNHQNGNYPSDDQGLYDVTGNDTDKGRFKIPTLRNLRFTTPYFHDGSAADLNEALTLFQNGGRNITYGDWAGDGRKNPFKSPWIKPISMNSEDKQALIDFLQSLNDTITHSPKRIVLPHEEISGMF